MPGVPNITLIPDEANAHVTIELSPGAGNEPQYYEVQYSVDNGQTWRYVRRADPVAYDGDPTVVRDYEFATGRETFYRARAYELDAGDEPVNVSNWSVPQGVTLRVRTWWLKDPFNPERNDAVSVW